MKKISALLLLAGGLLFSANPTTAVLEAEKAPLPFEESVVDTNNLTGVALKKAAIDTGTYEVSKTYVQVGETSEGYYQLRFVTAVKGKISSLKYSRSVDGGTAAEKAISTVYKGISGTDSNGTAVTYYYTDAGLTTTKPETIEYYWTCYTAQFNSSTYHSAVFDVDLIVNEETKAGAKTSLNGYNEGNFRVDVNYYNVGEESPFRTKGEFVAKNQLATFNALSAEGKVASRDYINAYADSDKEVNFYYAEEEAYTSTTVASTSLTGAGTETDPYLINSVSDLLYLDAQVEAENTFKGQYLKLTKNLDMSSYTNFSIGSVTSSTDIEKFGGYFDGNNCSIKYNIDNKGATRQGLFQQVSEDGTIANLVSKGTVNGGQYAGGLVGKLDGTASNCYSYVNLTQSSGNGAGGITGGGNGLVDNCENYGTVTCLTANNKTAGIMGAMETGSTVTNSTNYGNVTGTKWGIAGVVGEYQSGATKVENNKNFGLISSSTASAQHVAGIVGVVRNGVIQNNKNYGEIKATGTGAFYIAGITGLMVKGTIQNNDNYGDVTGDYKWVAGITGEAQRNASVIDNCNNYGDVTLVSTANDDSGNPTAIYAGGIVGNSAKGVTNCNNYGNVSGYCRVGGIMANLAGSGTGSTIENCNNYGSVTGTASLAYTGGIIGVNQGDITVSECTNEGAINGTYYTGGILGCVGTSATATINSCTNSGVITASGNGAGGIAGGILKEGTALNIINCSNSGSVTANNKVGGIVGALVNGDNPTGCTNTGTITATRDDTELEEKNLTGEIIGSDERTTTTE